MHIIILQICFNSHHENVFHADVLNDHDHDGAMNGRDDVNLHHRVYLENCNFFP